MKSKGNRLVQAFQRASGMLLYDYLLDRTNRGWRRERMLEEMVDLIQKCRYEKLKDLMIPSMANLNRWCNLYQIESLITQEAVAKKKKKSSKKK